MGIETEARGGSRTAAISKMEHFVIIVNGREAVVVVVVVVVFFILIWREIALYINIV